MKALRSMGPMRLCHGSSRLAPDDAGASESDWAPVINSSDHAPSSSSDPSSPPLSPSPFAPTGRPLVKARFRKNAPTSIPSRPEIIAHPPPLQSVTRNCSVRCGPCSSSFQGTITFLTNLGNIGSSCSCSKHRQRRQRPVHREIPIHHSCIPAPERTLASGPE
jgi:hypothetical protein